MRFGLKLKWIGLILLIVLSSGPAKAQNTVLPITLDYPLLNSLAASRLFKGGETEAELIQDPRGCRRLVISHPVFSSENGRLRFEIKVRARAGVELKNDCVLPVEWEGYVVFFQIPEITPDGFQLSFRTENSTVLNKHRETGLITGSIWDLIKDNVHARVDQIRIDLLPCVDEMKAFLALMFPESVQQRAAVMLDSIRPGTMAVQDTAIRVTLNADVSSVYDDARVQAEAPLGEEELSAFIRTWELMDAFVVHLIHTMAGSTLPPDETGVVLETLLDTRYRFVDELEEPEKDMDFVRDQFVRAWDNLSPIFRRHAENTASGSPMGTLAFFSSLDALTALDALGPAVGIEISRDGLMRLARLISDDGRVPDLDYSMETDSKLRRALGFLPDFQPFPGNPEDDPDGKTDYLKKILRRLIGSTFRIMGFGPLPEAVAADRKKPDRDDPAQWLPDTADIDGYVGRIRQALKSACDQTVVKNKPDPKFRGLLYPITDAVAWQESCFRQFRQAGGKIEYLRSYNNTSVGIMQINERVWRGVYDSEKLKWNIRYNMAAGCEIINHYLHQYILRKMDRQHYAALDKPDNIARTLYAMYNGGPGEFSKFLTRLSQNKLYLSDRLFYEKYMWVKQNQWGHASICLVGQ